MAEVIGSGISFTRHIEDTNIVEGVAEIVKFMDSDKYPLRIPGGILGLTVGTSKEVKSAAQLSSLELVNLDSLADVIEASMDRSKKTRSIAAYLLAVVQYDAFENETRVPRVGLSVTHPRIQQDRQTLTRWFGSVLDSPYRWEVGYDPKIHIADGNVTSRTLDKANQNLRKFLPSKIGLTRLEVKRETN
ncbi:hypothetical protein KW803_00360 [Candidatus Saccharibacteria bacterium]|nr:hypothetical protein [Candidatus Saccharibacteria bacterium]